MGNSDSSDGDTNKSGTSDDKCIGNRRVRTIILSMILIAFSAFAAAYVFKSRDIYAKEYEYMKTIPVTLTHDWVESKYHGWNIILSGLIITLVGAICSFVLFFIPNCDDKLGRVAGLILIFGGLLYVIGWIYLVCSEKAYFKEVDDVTAQSIWDTMTKESRTAQNASWSAQVGESLLFGISALLLGIDAMLHWYEDEFKRLSSNLGILMIVAAMSSNSYYLQICGDDEVCVIPTPDGVVAIATGYLILFWTCLVYCILYLCSCCTCNCKDTCLVRVIMAFLLLCGGCCASVGYYVYVGGYENATLDTGDDVDLSGQLVAFYIGYTILIGGLPAVWAVDIALDDIKNDQHFEKD